MRKFTAFIIIFLIFLGVLFYVGFEKDYVSESIDNFVTNGPRDLPKLKASEEKKELKQLLHGELVSLIDKTSDEVDSTLGEPIRKDLTPYGYTWWIYKDENNYQIQVGIENDIVQTIYATGNNIATDPFQIGSSYEDMNETFSFDDKVTYQSGLSFYTFILHESDLTMHPLIKVSEDVFVQCYFDTFTQTLSSIRIVTGEILLKQRVYEMEYRGSLPEEKVLSEEEWREVEKGMELQIFELTNIYRNRFNVPPLVQDDQVREVAYLHSKDMYDNNYFSHYSPEGNGLKERLGDREVYYLSAGENIAAQHTDGPAAIEGWLNSEGHREALLQEEYSHIGVGVYQLYYTQNFLLKP